MTKYIHALFIALMIAVLMPVEAAAEPSIVIIEQEQTPVVVMEGEQTVRVQNANGQVMYVYNVTGVCVQTIRIEGQDKRIELNYPKGCYIIKIGKTVRKVSVK